MTSILLILSPVQRRMYFLVRWWQQSLTTNKMKQRRTSPRRPRPPPLQRHFACRGCCGAGNWPPTATRAPTIPTFEYRRSSLPRSSSNQSAPNQPGLQHSHRGEPASQQMTVRFHHGRPINTVGRTFKHRVPLVGKPEPMDPAERRAKNRDKRRAYQIEYRQRPISSEQREEKLKRERERGRNRRAARKSKRLCHSCANTAAPGKARCSSCAEHHRLQMNARNAQLDFTHFKHRMRKSFQLNGTE